jgi:hypothetical protein
MAKPNVPHSQETTQKSERKIGRLIATVLNHPDSPEGVYNAIGDAMAELQSQPGHLTRLEIIQAFAKTLTGTA